MAGRLQADVLPIMVEGSDFSPLSILHGFLASLRPADIARCLNEHLLGEILSIPASLSELFKLSLHAKTVLLAVENHDMMLPGVLGIGAAALLVKIHSPTCRPDQSFRLLGSC